MAGGEKNEVDLETVRVSIKTLQNKTIQECVQSTWCFSMHSAATSVKCITLRPITSGGIALRYYLVPATIAHLNYTDISQP